MEASRVSLARYFRTLRHASILSWPRLLWKWGQARAAGERPSLAEICEFSSIETYDQQYAALGALLGKPKQTPPPNEIDFLHAVRHRRERYIGAVSQAIIAF